MKMNLLEFIVVNNPIRKFVQSKIEIKGFLDVPNFVKNKKVLEIGCGNGYGTNLINKYFQPKEVYGIDVDERMIQLAKKNKSLQATFSVGDVTNLFFKDESIDGVFDFVILHHIPNWKRAIDEIYRILKRGGQVFIEDASLETFNTPFGRLIKMLTDHPYKSMYRMEELFNYIENKGFQIIKKKVYKPLGLTSRFVLVGIKK